jgi:hypothetical protein
MSPGLARGVPMFRPLIWRANGPDQEPNSAEDFDLDDEMLRAKD